MWPKCAEGTEENHEKHQPRYLISRPRFEPGTTTAFARNMKRSFIAMLWTERNATNIYKISSLIPFSL